MDVLLQFAKDSGFNRIYFSLLGQTEEEPSRLPAFRLHAAQEKDLADLSYLTSQLEENKISLSLVFRTPFFPFSFSPRISLCENGSRSRQFHRCLGWRKAAA